MALPATENFTGAAGALPNPPWTDQAASAPNAVNRNGSGAFTQATLDGTDNFSFWNQDTFAADHYSQYVIGPVSAGGQWYKVLVRAKDTGSTAFDNYDFFTDGGTGAGHSQVQKWVNGTPTAIANVTMTAVNGDTIKATAVGDQLSFYKNGTLVGGPYTDASLTTGSPGIGCSVNVGGTLAGDNWEGGNIPAGGFAAYPTFRAPAKAGPYDAKGFLLSNFTRYSYTPSVVVAAITVLPGFGDLQLTGFAPTVAVSNNQNVAAGVGALTVTGFAPSAVIGTRAYPGAGSLTLAGQAPSAVIGTVAYPGVGALTLTGFAPGVVLGTVAYPGTGALTLSGFAPAANIGINVQVGLGALTLSGFAPTVTATNNQTVAAGLGALTLLGFAPSVAISDNQVAAAGSGALSLAGFAPAINIGVNAQAGTGQLDITGFAPTVVATANAFVSPDVGALAIDGFAPTVQGTAQTAVGMPMGGFREADSGDVLLRPGTGRLFLEGFAPAVSVTDHIVIEPGTGELGIDGHAPTVRIPRRVWPKTGRIVFQSFAPTVRTPVEIHALAGELVCEGFRPVVEFEPPWLAEDEMDTLLGGIIMLMEDG